MPNFSVKSKRKLAEAHPDLQLVFNEVIKIFDCSVLCGYRTEEEQDELFRQGMSKVRYPDSKHNYQPSNAVDVAPYPIDWNDRERFYFFAGHVIGIAHSMGIKLRHGGDWDGDKDIKDQSFYDLPHFELVQ
ncbi:MAG: M15 family metallopeptidase [Thiohalomonadales bacterium]